MSERRFWLGMTPLIGLLVAWIGAAAFTLYAVFIAPHLRWEAIFVMFVAWAYGQCVLMALPLLLPMPKPWERLPPPPHVA